MIKITIEIEEQTDEKGSVTVHTKCAAIGTVREAVFAKAILKATTWAQKWVTEEVGSGKMTEIGKGVEYIGPVGEG